MNIESLYHRFGLKPDKNELKTVLTHNSFSASNNSRYVFLGMFGFKGKVAEWVYANIQGNGTQLQHYLGNLFSQKKLEAFFDKYIHHIDRINPEVNLSQQKHIFVFAVFGHFMTMANEEQLTEFIYTQLIAPNDHLLPANHTIKNPWDELIFLCKQNFDARPKLQQKKQEDFEHISILLNNEIIGEHASVSYKYAKKKAINLALKHVATVLEQELEANPKHQLFEKMRREKLEQEKQAEKEARQKKHEERILSHSEKMKERKALLKKQAQEADRKRREAKQKAKEKKQSRKGANSIYREYTLEEIQAMSVSKRRNLEDRGIIPSGLVK